MNQVKVFTSESELNDWLDKYSSYEVVDIKFQIESANHYRYMVWYKKYKPQNRM